MKTQSLLCATLMSLTLPAFASNWTGSGELGFSNSSGNSKDRTLNTKVDMDYAADSWRHNIFGDIYQAKSDGDTTAERYALGYKPSYFLNDRDYVFGLARYDQDQFSDIDNRWTEVVGVGRQFINSDETYLEAEVGVGARQTDYVSVLNTADESEVLFYTGGRFTHRLTDTTRFLQIVRVEKGSDNTYAESVTGIQLSITDAMSAKITHTVRHNTDIIGALGEKTDQITGVNVVYSF